MKARPRMSNGRSENGLSIASRQIAPEAFLRSGEDTPNCDGAFFYLGVSQSDVIVDVAIALVIRMPGVRSAIKASFKHETDVA